MGFATDTLQREAMAIAQAPGTPDSAKYVKGADKLVTGSITANGQSVGADFDALDYQSASIEVSGTFVGTLAIERSNGGVFWQLHNLAAAGITPATSMNTPSIVSGDIGARYLRVRATAWTSGTAAVVICYNAFSLASAPVNNVVVSSGNLSPSAVASIAGMTTTNLAANALYTSGNIDMGSVAATLATRIRPTVRHLAGLTPGTLILEESGDNFTTVAETRRVPIPSDGQSHTFDWPVHNRYWRLKFQNGATAQTAFRLDYQQLRTDGGTVDTSGNLNFPLSVTALGASATFAGPTLDLGANHNWNVLRAIARADQGGSVFVQQSPDGVNWYQTTSAASPANAVTTLEDKIIMRYLRVGYTNGTGAQGQFMLQAALVTL